ncbi:MAG: HTH domain-containing protein [Gemmatimonadales bacterium]
MQQSVPGLSAHRGLRGETLVELKKAQPLTTQELAERFGVTANAIRRHLKELEVEGLVVYERVQLGQGAPTFAYRLSSAGEELFPKRYEAALTALLRHLEALGGREEVRRFFTARFRIQADQLKDRLDRADLLEHRVAAVAEFLSAEGFMADWSQIDGQLTIAEHNCAMHAVAEQFPEVCESELAFLRELFGPHVERTQHIVAGCNACQYAIRTEQA